MAEEPDPKIVRRLHPELRPLAVTRSDLSAGRLALVRESLDDRRRRSAAEIDTAGVDIEDTRVRRDDGVDVPVRVYCAGPAPAPTVIYCHAGAFVLGNLDTDHHQCVELARRARCTVISVDYRLAPEHPFPAAINDAAAVLESVWAHPRRWDADRDRLAVAGSSAGAGLAAGLAQRSAAGELPPLVFALLHQPVLDDRPTPSKAEFAGAPSFDGPATVAMWHHYLGGAPATAAAVPARNTQLLGIPTTFITCAELDPLRDEALDYARRLTGSGIRTDLHLFGGTCHGFDSLCPEWEVSRELFAMQGQALRRALGQAGPSMKMSTIGFGPPP